MPEKNQMRLVNVISELKLNEMEAIDRHGRACYKVSARTLPDDIVMNRVKYPASEIEKGYRTLNNKPAPLGHPKVGGWNVSGNDPEGINRHWCGAWNGNVRRVLESNGKYRIHHDIYIDIEKAKESDNGRRVLKAFEKGEPIHTSTGVLCNVEWADEKDDFDWIARNITLDHNAILLDEQGAGTPADGVGVFVNQEVDENKHLTINTFRYKEKNTEDVTPVSDDKPKEKPMPEKTNENKEVPATKPEPTPTDNVTLSKADLAELIGNAVSSALKARDEQAAATEKTELVDKIVAVNLLSKENAEKLDVATLRELAKSTGNKEKTADVVNPADVFSSNDKSTGDGSVTFDNMFEGYSLNEHLEEKPKSQPARVVA